MSYHCVSTYYEYTELLRLHFLLFRIKALEKYAQLSYSKLKIFKRLFLRIFLKGVVNLCEANVPKVKKTSGGDLYHCIQHRMSFKTVLHFIFKTFYSKVIPPESSKRGFFNHANTKTLIKTEQEKQSIKNKTVLKLILCSI